MCRELLKPCDELILGKRVSSTVEGLEFGNRIAEQLREGDTHLSLEFAEPIVDLWIVLEQNGILEHDLFTLS